MNRYDTKQFEPPAPAIMVEVSNRYEKMSEKLKGKIDTGADISIIPADLIEKIKLFPAGEVKVKAYNDRESLEPTCFVDISFDNHKFYVSGPASGKSTRKTGGF